ncbi:hypothetical protein AURANDRAFT_69145, partial [Aureococcus anophagefferens]
RCAAALVVSDAAVRCDEDGPCVASVAVDCAASHAGLPCKSARALEASLAAAPRARWHVRVMDDTYVDVDALAWHLGDLDDAQPWYVGDTVAVPREGAGRADQGSARERNSQLQRLRSRPLSTRADGATFRVALGGAGWALSGPAAALAAAHLDLYFSLASGMVRASDGGREWALPASRLGRALADAGRGMRLDSHIADDVFFGTFMAALGVGAAGPRGFTQAPVDARGGVPPCGPAAAAAAESRGPDDADCGDPQRHHDLGAVWLSDPATGALVEVDDLVAAGSCRRPFARPAVVHLGDEIGGFNNARWRGQFGDLHRALADGTAVVATYEPCAGAGEEFFAAAVEEPARAGGAAPAGLALNPGASPDDARFLDGDLSRHLKPHQERGVRFMWERCVGPAEEGDARGCVLADHMGLGKTLQLICVLKSWLGGGPPRRTALVIAPAFVLSNWLGEIERWLPRDRALRPRTLPAAGGAAARLAAVAAWQREGGALLVGYEMFRMLAGGAGARAEFVAALCDPGPGLLVLDEAHRLKEPRSQLYKAMGRIRTRRRVLASGYPVQNRLDEYWALVTFARPAALGSYDR